DVINPKEFVIKNYTPYVTSSEGGLAIAQVREDGKRYFHFYGEQGNELRRPLEVSKVVIELFSIKHKQFARDMKTIIEVVDPELEIYWPIFFSADMYLEKPDNFVGFLRPIKFWESGKVKSSTR